MSDEEPESLEQLLEAGRCDFPDPARLRRLGARLGFGAGLLPTGIAAAKGGGAVLGGAPIKIGLAVLVAVAGAGAVATFTASHPQASQTALPSPDRPSAAQPVASSTAPASVSPSSTSSSSSPASARTEDAAADAHEENLAPAPPAAKAPARAPSAVPKATPASNEAPAPGVDRAAGIAAAAARPPPGETEFSLLEQAQRSMASDPQRALGLVDRAGALYPAGPLAQEREVIAIEALVKMGRTDEARARAAQFSRTFPGSAHTQRISGLVDPANGSHNP